MTVKRLPTSPAMTRLRERVEAIDSDQLVSIAEKIEDNQGRTDEERIVYAVACTTLCRRLDVSTQEAIESPFGAATFLGVRAAFASL